MDLKFLNKYLNLNLKDYSNIGIDLEINKLLLCFLVGAIVASVLMSFNTTRINITVKKLLRRSALNEESALTLDELGINTWSIRRLLSASSQLKRLVARVGEPQYTYEEYIALTKKKGYKEEKIDFSLARFYLREDGLARSRHIVEVGQTSILNTVLFSVLLVAIYCCLALLMPEILTLINNLLNN